MNAHRVAYFLGLLIGPGIAIPGAPAIDQAPSPKDEPPQAPGSRKLIGANAGRAAELNNAIAAALKADRWDEAVARAEELVALRRQVQGPAHFETVDDEWRLKALRRVALLPAEDRVAFRSAKEMNQQANALSAQGKYAQAQPLYEKALEIRRRLLSDEHPDTATSYNNLAVNLDDRGKYAQAQPLKEKALDIRRRLLSDEHPDTATSYNNLAINLNFQGKYAQAQLLLEKALEIKRRLLTDEHTDTASGYNNLASNLDAQGKYAQAQSLFEKALEIKRRLLTDEHPHTASSYNGLAYNLWKQGKHGQAQPLFEKALEIRRRLLTEEHPDTAQSYNNVASNLNAQGKYAQAQPLLEKALEIRRRLLSDEHPDTATSYNNVADNLRAQGKYAQAQPLYEKALEINRRLLTDEHPATARSYHNLATNLSAQGKYAEAQPLLEKALEIKRRLLTDEHPDTAGSYNNLATNLSAQGKYAEAQPLLEKAQEINRRRLTDEHPSTAGSYNNLASNLSAQGKYAEAQPLYEKALEIKRRLLTDEHPDTAIGYSNVASNLDSQGKYAQAQPLYEKALEINRRLLADEHPTTAQVYNNLAYNLSAQGKYAEARDQWLSAVKSQDAARLRIAFTGLERAAAEKWYRLSLAAVLARVGQPSQAWQSLEEDLGRGLLDELAARQDRRLTPGERGRLRALTAELEQLDRLTEATPKDLDQAERARRFEELKHRRARASIALGELQTQFVQEYGALAGQVASRDELQAALPADAALITWVDRLPGGPNAADPDGEHWGVVVRARGLPAWIPIAGTGPDGLWTDDDTMLVIRVRTRLRMRPGASTADLGPSVEKLRAQRLRPLDHALGATADGLPEANRLIVLPSQDLAGIPIEALLAPDDTRTVSYAPSATVSRYLREQPRPDRHAGLLVLGDPIFARPDQPSVPGPLPLPDHGLLVNTVVPGANAARHGVRSGDVLLAYNGKALWRREDLAPVAAAEKPIAIETWREGRSSPGAVDPGALGVVIDRRPAPEAIAANRALDQVLLAARSGSEDFAPLPGTRYEAEALARLFTRDDRPVQSLLGADASEPALDQLAASGELGRFGFIHLATHGVIDESVPERSAVILTQAGLPDPLEQVLHQKPVYDGRLSVREIQRAWELKAELVTLSACETALGRSAGGEGFVGFTQALLMSGTRSVCLSLWKVDDLATALLMERFYANLLGRRPGLDRPLPKAEALREAKAWLRDLRRAEAAALAAALSGGAARAKGAKARQPAELITAIPGHADDDRPYAAPYYWAAFVLIGDPE